MTKLYLLLSALGLMAAGAGYGLFPQQFLPLMMKVNLESADTLHLLRALMGAYVGIGMFWLYTAFVEHLQKVALGSVLLFMSSVAITRIASIWLDGKPSGLFVLYLAVELIMIVFGLLLLRSQRQRGRIFY